MRAIPHRLEVMRGSPTAFPRMVAYRVGKLRRANLLRGSWLDLGCADGGYVAALIEAGVARMVGVDIEVDRVERARARNVPTATFVVAASEALPFDDESFDGVLLNEVLEHVVDESATLSEIHRVLRPGAVLVVISPNRWFPFEGHGARVGRLRLGFPVPLLPYVPKAISGRFMQARNYWPRELAQLVRGAGFVVERPQFVLPMFEQVPWLPTLLIRPYLRAVPVLERTPVIRRLMGVSTMLVARRRL